MWRSRGTLIEYNELSEGGSVARLLAQPGTPFDVAPDIIEALPVAIYACDTQGRILWFNYRAAELWGRQPALNDAAERFCGSYKLYFNGRLTPLDRCPMAYVLRTGNPVHSAEGPPINSARAMRCTATYARPASGCASRHN